MIQLKLRGYSDDEKCILLKRLMSISDCGNPNDFCDHCQAYKVCRDINNAIAFLMDEVDSGYSLQEDDSMVLFEIVADPTAEDDAKVPLQWAETDD